MVVLKDERIQGAQLALLEFMCNTINSLNV